MRGPIVDETTTEKIRFDQTLGTALGVAAYKAKVDTLAQRSIDVARRNVRRAQLLVSEFQQYDQGWNITMPDARLMPLWHETRAQGTAHPPQLRGCPAARRRGMPHQTIW